MNASLLLVEDDLALRTGLEDTFAQEGFTVVSAADGERAARLLRVRTFDVAVLDIMLPGKSGLEVLKELRERDGELPVLILTAKGDESDKVIGLELGADDYLTKPFGTRELIARVRALLRRRGRGNVEESTVEVVLGEAVVDLWAFEVRRGEERHPLSQKEAAMLELLLREAPRVVSRRRFLDEVWGTTQFVGNRTIDTHVLNLRKKIEADPRNPRFLLTVHGIGYKLQSS